MYLSENQTSQRDHELFLSTTFKAYDILFEKVPDPWKSTFGVTLKEICKTIIDDVKLSQPNRVQAQLAQGYFFPNKRERKVVTELYKLAQIKRSVRPRKHSPHSLLVGRLQRDFF